MQPHHSMLAVPTSTKPKRRTVHLVPSKIDKKTRTSPDSVHIRELTVAQGGLGCAIWDGSIVLARWLHLHPSCTRDLVGLELGSGVGVPGIVAARTARRVVLTDYMEEVVANLAYNLALNGNVELDEEDDEERDEVELARRRALRTRVRASGRAALLDWHAIDPDAEDLERMQASAKIEAEAAQSAAAAAASSSTVAVAAAPSTLSAAVITDDSSLSSEPFGARLSSLGFDPSPHWVDPTGLGPASCDFLLGSELIYTYNRHHQECFRRILQYYLKPLGVYYCVQSMNREGMPEFLADLAGHGFHIFWQLVDTAKSGLTGTFHEKPKAKEFVQREEQYVFYVIQKKAAPSAAASSSAAAAADSSSTIDVASLSLAGGVLQDMLVHPVPSVSMLRDAEQVAALLAKEQHQEAIAGVTAAGIGMVEKMIPKAFAKQNKGKDSSNKQTAAGAGAAAGAGDASSDAAADGAWEQQTTRKQRKKQAKEAAATAPVAAPADDDVEDFPVSAEPQAASSSSFPMDAPGADESAMHDEFMQAGFIGLDGKQIPAGAPLYVPPPQPAPAAAAAPASAASSSSSGVTPSAGGAAGRRPRYVFDETQMPKCFVCQVRHDIGQCRRKEKL